MQNCASLVLACLVYFCCCATNWQESRVTEEQVDLESPNITRHLQTSSPAVRDMTSLATFSHSCNKSAQTKVLLYFETNISVTVQHRIIKFYGLSSAINCNTNPLDLAPFATFVRCCESKIDDNYDENGSRQKTAIVHLTCKHF